LDGRGVSVVTVIEWLNQNKVPEAKRFFEVFRWNLSTI